jgi:hypothetical protein
MTCRVGSPRRRAVRGPMRYCDSGPVWGADRFKTAPGLRQSAGMPRNRGSPIGHGDWEGDTKMKPRSPPPIFLRCPSAFIGVVAVVFASPVMSSSRKPASYFERQRRRFVSASIPMQVVVPSVS